MNKILIKKILTPFIKIKYRVKSKGMIYIGKGCKIDKPKSLILEKNINICSNSILICNEKLIIEDNSYIGYFSEIQSLHKIKIGKNVICGPYLFITDSNHEYKNVDIPICDQGRPYNENSQVIIDEDSWIGAHVCIIGNVNIGKHCVIAAGSVVTKDIPSYCVAGGVPARVIKKYNFNTKAWENVK